LVLIGLMLLFWVMRRSFGVSDFQGGPLLHTWALLRAVLYIKSASDWYGREVHQKPRETAVREADWSSKFVSGAQGQRLSTCHRTAYLWKTSERCSSPVSDCYSERFHLTAGGVQPQKHPPVDSNVYFHPGIPIWIKDLPLIILSAYLRLGMLTKERWISSLSRNSDSMSKSNYFRGITFLPPARVYWQTAQCMIDVSYLMNHSPHDITDRIRWFCGRNRCNGWMANEPRIFNHEKRIMKNAVWASWHCSRQLCPFVIVLKWIAPDTQKWILNSFGVFNSAACDVINSPEILEPRKTDYSPHNSA
jgi:hypothetical protein